MFYTNDKVPIRFGGGIEVSRPWLAADEHRAQRILRKHHSESVLCLCTPHGVPMHVVCRDGKFFLATNPGRASHHALSCPAYQPDEDTSGLRHYSGEALARSRGLYKLQVRHHPPTEPPFAHFSVSAALQFIWEFAGLNVCTPKTVVHRSFLAVSRSLAEISHKVRFNNRGLRLYVPTAVSDIDGCRYAIGQISKVFHGAFANGIRIAADREHTFWVDEKQWNASALGVHLGTYEEPARHQTIWLMGKLWQSPNGNWKLFDVGLLPVNDQLLPALPQAIPALDQLVQSKRRFVVCQRYDAINDDTVPLAILIDRPAPQVVSYPLSS